MNLAASFRLVGLLVVIDLVGGEQGIRGFHPGVAAQMQHLPIGLLLVRRGLGHFARSGSIRPGRPNGHVRVGTGLDRNRGRG